MLLRVVVFFLVLLAAGCARGPSAKERDLAMLDEEARAVLGRFEARSVRDLGWAVTTRRWFPWPAVRRSGPHRYRIDGSKESAEFLVVPQPDGPDCWQMLWGAEEATATVGPLLLEGIAGLEGNCRPAGSLHRVRASFLRSDCDGFDPRGRYAQATVLLREERRLSVYTIMAMVPEQGPAELLSCFSDAELMAGRAALVQAVEEWFAAAPEVAAYGPEALLQTDVVGRSVADGRVTARVVLKVHDAGRVDSWRLEVRSSPEGWRVRRAKFFVDPADLELP